MTRPCSVAKRRAASLAAAALIAGALDAAAQPRDLRTSQVMATDGTAFDVTRGTVQVVENRRTRGRRTIDLAFVRVRPAGTAAAASVHLVLAGGPGDSGVEQVLGLARQGGALIAGLLQGDIVGIDQRGTGRSAPNLASSVLYGLPLDRPGSPDTWLPIIERASAAEAARLRAAGIDLEAYNTRESAEDVADVCAALGYTRVTLWGRSYGTHLALATLAKHPALVERMILVSPEGLDHTWKLPSQTDAVLARLETRGAGSLVSPLAEVLERLRREPVRVETTHPQTGQPVTIFLGAFDVQWIVAQALGDPRLLATLPAAVRTMRDGSFQQIAQIAVLRRERAGIQSAMKMMMDLSSGASPARLTRIEREAAAATLGNAINFPGMYLQQAWGAVDLGEAFRAPVRSDVPALLLVGDLDPRTPVGNAREIAGTLSRSSVVVVENATHQFDLFGTPAIRDLLARFLRGDAPLPDRVPLPPLAFK